jgi:hypothetical protein
VGFLYDWLDLSALDQPGDFLWFSRVGLCHVMRDLDVLVERLCLVGLLEGGD